MQQIFVEVNLSGAIPGAIASCKALPSGGLTEEEEGQPHNDSAV